MGEGLSGSACEVLDIPCTLTDREVSAGVVRRRRQLPSGWKCGAVVHRGSATVWGVDLLLAIVTVDGGGVELVPVIEVGGQLVRVVDLVPVELVALVALVEVPAPVLVAA